MKSACSHLLQIVTILAVLSAQLWAQGTATGSLEGNVLDASGAAVPGAEVKITNKETGLVRVATTNNEGEFRFESVPAGIYQVRTTAKGFAVAVSERVELAVSQTTRLNQTVQPGTQNETVVVEGATPLVDVSKTDVSLAITPREVQELPLNGRDFVNLAVLAPGAKPVASYDPTKNRIGVFAVNGSDGRNVNVTVNGVDNKDNTVGGPVMQLPLEAIQEFNISTQRFSAANGRSEGASVNVITKSGTNDVHGSLYLFERDQRLNATDYFSAQGNQPKAPYSRQQFGGSVGAPVRKDSDFVFFAIEKQRERTNLAVTPDAFNELTLLTPLGAQPAKNIPTPYDDWRYSGRFDHRFNSNNTLYFTYNNQHNSGLNDQSTQTNDLTAGNFTTNQLILANATLSSVINTRTVNQFTFGFQYWNNLIDSKVKSPTFTFPQGVTFGTNGNVPQESYQRKWQFRDDFSYTIGKHSIRTGFDLIWEPKLGGFFEFTPTPAIDFIDLPSVILSNKTKYPQGFATPGAVDNISATAGDPYFNLPGGSKQFGVFFQDDWRVTRRLSLNLGIRWDRDYNLIGASVQAQSRTYLALKAIGSPYAGIPKDDTKDFSPRFGFAYDVTGSGKHIIRGGYGIYYGQVFQNIPLFMIQQANRTIFATVLNINSGGPGDTTADVVPGTNILLSNWRYGIDPFPIIPGASPLIQAGSTGRLMDPNYHNPYSQQFNVGYAYQVTPNSVIEVEYIHELALRESKTININPKLVSLGGNRPLSAPFAAAGVPVLGRIDNEESIGRSRYDGLNVTYRKRLSNRFSINTNYVLSRAVAYNGNAGAFRDRPTDYNNYFLKTDFGPTPNDERHRWVFSGIASLPFGIQVAPIMQLASARPYTAIQGIDVFGWGAGRGNIHAIVDKSNPNDLTALASLSASQLRTGLASGQYLQVPFDSLRGSVFFQLDVRASKTFTFKERFKIEAFFQAFDLTNRANFGNNYDGNVQDPTFRKPQGFLTPGSTIIPQSFAGEVGARFHF